MKRENEAIRDKVVRDIRNFFELEEGGYYKLVRIGSFWRNSYIEYESSSDRKNN